MKLKVNPKELDNQKIAWILRLIAAAYTINKGPYFKIVAYNNAADEVEHLGVSLVDLWQQHKDMKVTNIGSSIKQHLLDLITKGESEHFNQLLRNIHPAVATLIKVPGIGPKLAYKLTQAFDFPEGDDQEILNYLIKLADTHQIGKLPRFGDKSEQRLKKLAEEYLQIHQKERYLLSDALQIAEPLIEHLKQLPQVEEAVVLGSLRRRLATVGDIDIAVKSSAAREVFDSLTKYPFFKSFEVVGGNKGRVVLKNGLRVDVIIAPPADWGSLVQYLTGSKFHNISLREYALKKGFSLSEHGIKDIRHKKLHHFAKEEDFYHFLGMEWIEPELRENRGEIEAALKGALPHLITLEDIKGDLHLHSSFNIKTNYDLGRDSVLTLAQRAKEKGYEYIAITDHLPRPTLSVNEKRELIKERNDLITQAEKETGIRIFKSLEVDILPNGELALEEEIIKLLDFLVVSVHTSFALDMTKMTERVIKGLSHPKAKFLAHPTGRLLNKRSGYRLNWSVLFEFVQENNKALEINSTPERLDISDEVAFSALKAGVKLVINTDSHSVQSMDWVRYGVWVARRSWAEKSDVLNSLPCQQLEKWLLK